MRDDSTLVVHTQSTSIPDYALLPFSIPSEISTLGWPHLLFTLKVIMSRGWHLYVRDSAPHPNTKCRRVLYKGSWRIFRRDWSFTLTDVNFSPMSVVVSPFSLFSKSRTNFDLPLSIVCQSAHDNRLITSHWISIPRERVSSSSPFISISPFSSLVIINRGVVVPSPSSDPFLNLYIKLSSLPHTLVALSSGMVDSLPLVERCQSMRASPHKMCSFRCSRMPIKLFPFPRIQYRSCVSFAIFHMWVSLHIFLSDELGASSRGSRHYRHNKRCKNTGQKRRGFRVRFSLVLCQFPVSLLVSKNEEPFLFSELTDHSVTNDHVEFECKTRNFQIYEVRFLELLFLVFLFPLSLTNCFHIILEPNKGFVKELIILQLRHRAHNCRLPRGAKLVGDCSNRREDTIKVRISLTTDEVRYFMGEFPSCLLFYSHVRSLSALISRLWFHNGLYFEMEDQYFYCVNILFYRKRRARCRRLQFVSSHHYCESFRTKDLHFQNI